jgi:hypothetical protein
MAVFLKKKFIFLVFVFFLFLGCEETDCRISLSVESSIENAAVEILTRDTQERAEIKAGAATVFDLSGEPKIAVYFGLDIK